MEREQDKSAVGIRVVLLAALAAGVATMPANAQSDCEQCVWDWNGSGYVASCQNSTSGGYNGCIVGGSDFCWVGSGC